MWSRLACNSTQNFPSSTSFKLRLAIFAHVFVLVSFFKAILRQGCMSGPTLDHELLTKHTWPLPQEHFSGWAKGNKIPGVWTLPWLNPWCTKNWKSPCRLPQYSANVQSPPWDPKWDIGQGDTLVVFLPGNLSHLQEFFLTSPQPFDSLPSLSSFPCETTNLNVTGLGGLSDCWWPGTAVPWG